MHQTREWYLKISNADEKMYSISFYYEYVGTRLKSLPDSRPDYPRRYDFCMDVQTERCLVTRTCKFQSTVLDNPEVPSNDYRQEKETSVSLLSEETGDTESHRYGGRKGLLSTHQGPSTYFSVTH